MPIDVDSPVFKANVGTVKYVPDKSCMVWVIKQFPGLQEFLMRTQFGFPSIKDEARENFKRIPI